MKYLVLVSHGGLAEGVQSSLGMFASDKTDQVIAVGLKAGKSVAITIWSQSAPADAITASSGSRTTWRST